MGSLLTEIDRQDALIRDQETIIASFIATRPGMRRQLDLLVTIPGVSLVVGAGLLAAIGTVRRFAAKKKLAGYFGFVPSTEQSGDHEARNGKIAKHGRSEARWLLTEAAEHPRKAPGRSPEAQRRQAMVLGAVYNFFLSSPSRRMSTKPKHFKILLSGYTTKSGKYGRIFFKLAKTAVYVFCTPHFK